MTRQRALILDIMREKSPQHLTADELFNEARLRMPHIARGTVYRNLKMMRRLRSPGGPAGSGPDAGGGGGHRHRGARLYIDHPLPVPQVPRGQACG